MSGSMDRKLQRADKRAWGFLLNQPRGIVAEGRSGDQKVMVGMGTLIRCGRWSDVKASLSLVFGN